MAEQLSNPAAPADSSVEPHPVQVILRFLRVVYRHKGIVIVALAASCLLGGLYNVRAPTVYESRSSLLILQTGETGTWSTRMSNAARVQGLMETYKNMLQSQAVMEAALKTLPPERLGNLKKVSPEHRAKVLVRNLNTSIVRGTAVLNLAYRSKDPEAAAAVLNSILSAYLDFVNRFHQDTSGELLRILNGEKVKLEEQIRVKQDQLIAARRDANELGLRGDGQKVSVLVKRVVSLNESWIKAHEARLDAQSKLATVESAIRSGEDLVELALTMSNSMGGERFLQRLGLNPPDSYANDRLSQQLMKDRAELESALQLYGPAHNKVREIQGRISMTNHLLQNQYQIRNAQLHQLNNQELAPLFLTTARQQLAQATEKEKLVLASYEEAKSAAVGLDGTRAQIDILELDWNRLQQTYDVVLNRLENIDLSQKNSSFRVSILNRPEVPNAPISANRKKVAMLSVVIGLVVGLAIVYLLDLLDDRFRSPEEIQAQLQLPVLATVGRLEQLADSGIDAIHTYVQPHAIETEAFRTLRAALAIAEDNPQSLVISSSEPGDGKTTVAANLAMACAQSGKRTLLIDANMRRPGLTLRLNLKGQHGLSAVLRDGPSVAEAAEANLYRLLAENLDVLPSGPLPTNPSELLAGDRFSELLSWAKTRYDQIFIDGPAAMVIDAAIVGRLIDGVLLTVQLEKNRRRVVTQAAESLSLLGIKVLGIVVNCIRSEKGADYYDCDYSYGYDHGCGYHDDSPKDNVKTRETARPSTVITQRVA